jgi:hypothetical protein
VDPQDREDYADHGEPQPPTEWLPPVILPALAAVASAAALLGVSSFVFWLFAG